MASKNTDVSRFIQSLQPAWQPPPELSLSRWAEEFFYLSPESASEPGKSRICSCQLDIMDAITDGRYKRITVRKSARVGDGKVAEDCFS